MSQKTEKGPSGKTPDEAIDRALILKDEGLYVEARLELYGVLRRHPGHERATQVLRELWEISEDLGDVPVPDIEILLPRYPTGSSPENVSRDLYRDLHLAFADSPLVPEGLVLNEEDNPDVFTDLVVNWFFIEDYERIVSAVDDRVKRFPNHPARVSWWVLKGEALFRSGRDLDLIRWFEQPTENKSDVLLLFQRLEMQYLLGVA